MHQKTGRILSVCWYKTKSCVCHYIEEIDGESRHCTKCWGQLQEEPDGRRLHMLKW